MAPFVEGDRSQGHALARDALESVFLSGMFLDLPLAGQLHPGMQARIKASMPLMDDAENRMMAFLRARTEGDLVRVQTVLRNGGAAASIIRTLDREAAATGVSEARRAQTRSILAQAEWRLRRQPPGMLVNECIAKVEKLSATNPEAEARQRWLEARIAEAGFWQQGQGAQQSTHDRWIARGGRWIGRGFIVFLVSGAVAGVGALLEAEALVVPGVVGATVGVVMMLSGLIVLLIGAVIPDRKPAS